MGFLERGLVHVYTGDGKGKTTSSLGLALRGVGHGMSVYITQFMKMGYTGEALAIRKYNLPILFQSFNVVCKNQAQHEADIQAGTFTGYCRDCFVPTAFDSTMAEQAFTAGKKAVESGEYDLVIFDELNVALHMKLLDTQRVVDMLRSKPVHTEIVLTGRNAPKEVLDAADYITMMGLKKHPYMKQIYARKGIEF